MTPQEKTVSLFLRVGVAFAFLYPPLSALSDPFLWIGYFPLFLRDLVSNDTLLLHTFGVFEIAIALWILYGKNIFYPSVLATLALLAIVFFNWSEFPVLFRDLSIATMAGALAFLHRKRAT